MLASTLARAIGNTSTLPHVALRVLLVDDNADFVESTTAVLSEQGYDVYPCTSAADVLTSVQQHNPDAVVLDIALPGKTGWELAREIRAARPGTQLMLIGISGEYTKGADRVLSQMTGFDYFLTKPFDNKVLLALLEKAAQMPQFR